MDCLLAADRVGGCCLTVGRVVDCLLTVDKVGGCHLIVGRIVGSRLATSRVVGVGTPLGSPVSCQQNVGANNGHVKEWWRSAEAGGDSGTMDVPVEIFLEELVLSGCSGDQDASSTELYG